MDLNLSSWTLPLCHVFVATTTERAKDFKTNSLSGQSNEESHSQSRRVCGWGCPAGFSSRNTSIQDAICGDALPKESDGISKTLSNGQRLLIFFWCCRVCCCRVYTSINQNNTRGIILILVVASRPYNISSSDNLASVTVLMLRWNVYESRARAFSKVFSTASGILILLCLASLVSISIWISHPLRFTTELKFIHKYHLKTIKNISVVVAHEKMMPIDLIYSESRFK